MKIKNINAKHPSYLPCCQQILFYISSSPQTATPEILVTIATLPDESLVQRFQIVLETSDNGVPKLSRLVAPLRHVIVAQYLIRLG